jgi:hypothetical protein
MSNHAKFVLRRFLTASYSTKYLFFVLIGSWVWLWAALDYPSLLTYVGYTLIALMFLWTRPLSVLRYAVEKRPVERRPRDHSQEKRGFLFVIGAIAVLPIIFTLRADPEKGSLIFALVCLAAVIYIALMPGETIPEGWLTKRGSQRKKTRD